MNQNVKPEDLVEQFSALGIVKEAKVMRNFRGETRGFGYVAMESTLRAQEIINSNTVVMIEGSRIMIDIGEGRTFVDEYNPEDAEVAKYKVMERRFQYEEERRQRFEDLGLQKEDNSRTKALRRGPRQDEHMDYNADYPLKLYDLFYTKDKEYVVDRINPVEPDPGSLNRSDRKIHLLSTVLVPRLPKTVNVDRLKILLATFGDVTGAIVDEKDGELAAKVRFSGPRSASKAIEAGGLEVDGDWLQINEAVKEKDPNDSRPPKVPWGATFFDRIDCDLEYRVPREFDPENDCKVKDWSHMYAIDHMQFRKTKEQMMNEMEDISDMEFSLHNVPRELGTIQGKVDPNQMIQECNDIQLCKVFVGNLPRTCTTQEFSDYWYAAVPNVKDCVSVLGRCFGFVTFDSAETAEKEMAKIHNLGGRRMNLKPNMYAARVHEKQTYKPKMGDGQMLVKGKLFVGQLDFDTTEEMFYEEFKQFGRVTDVQVFAHRGFGYVTFEDEREADKAIQSEVRFRGRLCSLNRVAMPQWKVDREKAWDERKNREREWDLQKEWREEREKEDRGYD